MRHYAKYNSEEYIVLGHNVKYNNCMMVRMSALPVEDQQALRSIANSEYAQSKFYLMPILVSQQHRSGKSWDMFLLEQMNRRGGPINTLPIKDIQESLDPAQKAVWKGYGKPSDVAPQPGLSPDSQALQEAWHPGSTKSEQPAMSPDFSIPAAPAMPMVNVLDRKVDELALTVVEESRMTRASIDRLVAVLEGALAPKQMEAKEKAETDVKPKRRVE